MKGGGGGGNGGLGLADVGTGAVAPVVGDVFRRVHWRREALKGIKNLGR